MSKQVQAGYKTFEELQAYQAAREFRKDTYGIARKLPDFEKFGLGRQIRRAAVSLTNNIAEGHGRYHFQDQIRFVLMARGSLQELVDDLNVCEDEAYVPAAGIPPLKEKAGRVSMLLGGYIRFLRERKFGQNLVLREQPTEYLSDQELDDLLD